MESTNFRLNSGPIKLHILAPQIGVQTNLSNCPILDLVKKVITDLHQTY